MQITQQKSKRKIEKKLSGDKNTSGGLMLGSIIATLVAITPYLYSLHESVPVTKTWDTFLFTYESIFWHDVNYAMWVFTGKLIPLYLLLLWFFTCKHWWYHTLIVPIAMYVFQLTVTINTETKYMDEFQLIYLLPVIAVVIPSIYLIRARIFNKVNNANKTLEELEEEFKISPKNFWEKVKAYF